MIQYALYLVGNVSTCDYVLNDTNFNCDDL